MKQSKLLAIVLCLVLPAILSTGALQAQHDLGPRGGLPGAGGAFPTLNANEQAFFNQAFLRFQEVQSVSGDIPGEDSEGLGPTFNGNSCTMCHAQPAIGGSSPGLASPQNTITRFGWKAQNKSLLIFAGEAYNVEQGVSNELFPNERSAIPSCVFNEMPEDSTNLVNSNSASPNNGTTVGTASEMLSDTANFAAFIRLLAPPTPSPQTTSTLNGSTLFSSIGCVLCHSPSLTTGASIFTSMGGVTYRPFSDFALHHMGSGLADGINQGAAGPDQFGPAPLWGLGQRLFFLHDGRTADVLQAIETHADCNGKIPDGNHDRFHPSKCSSEANGVINNFNALSPSQQQDILNFLRSL